MPYYQKRSSRPSGSGSRSNQSRTNNTARRGSSRRGPTKKYIHPSKFVNRAVPRQETLAYQSDNKFSDFGFCKQLMENVIKKGYESTTKIQDQAIIPVLEGRDVIGLANTGTGKTAAFLLPIINKHIGSKTFPSVLIIEPTRELAQQVEDEFRTFSVGLGLYSSLIVGGVPAERQIRELRRRPNFIIGTPGRLKDMIKRGYIKLDGVDTLILDEADRMLDMGFLPDIKFIVNEIPADRQTLLFSATITPEIAIIINSFTVDPVTISVRTSENNEHIEQDVIQARDKAHKIELLTEMLKDEAKYDKVLVFGETKFGVQRLSDHLDNRGILSVAIHGNKNQSQRQRALKQFKDGNVRVMVATDVAARGLDIPNVSHVINFDTPQTYEDYIHRIGRTGRAGADGHAHTFIDKY